MRSLINPFSVLRHVNLWDVAVFDVGGDADPDGPDADIAEGMVANTTAPTAPAAPAAPDGGAAAAEAEADAAAAAAAAEASIGFGQGQVDPGLAAAAGLGPSGPVGGFGGDGLGEGPDASLGPDPDTSYGDPGMVGGNTAPSSNDSFSGNAPKSNASLGPDPDTSYGDAGMVPDSISAISAIDSIAAGGPGPGLIDTVGAPPADVAPPAVVAPPPKAISKQIADNAKKTNVAAPKTFTPPTARSVMSTAREIAASKANQDRKGGPLSVDQIAANLTNATNFDGKWGYTTWDGKTVTKNTDQSDGGGVDIAGAGFARSGGRAADKNNDGFVTAAEAKDAGGLKGNFASSISNSIGATPLGSGLPTTGLASMVSGFGILPAIGMAAYSSQKEKTDYFGRGKTAPPTSLNAEGVVEAPQYGSYTSMGFGNSGQGTTSKSFERDLSVGGGPDSEDPVKLEPTIPGPVCPEGYEYDQEKNICVIDPFKEPFPETPTVPSVPSVPTGPTSPYTAAQPVGLGALLPTTQPGFVVPVPNVQPITVGTQQSGIMNPLMQQVFPYPNTIT